jgi:methyl-accepting chemotaxis protein
MLRDARHRLPFASGGEAAHRRLPFSTSGCGQADRQDPLAYQHHKRSFERVSQCSLDRPDQGLNEKKGLPTMKLSLRNKFLIPTLALIILGMVVSSTIGYLFARNALQNTLTDQLVTMVDSLDGVLTSWLRDRKVDLESWGTQKIYNSAVEDSFVGKAARKSANAALEDLRSKYPYYEDISLADATGVIVSSSNSKVIGKINVKDRDYFKASFGGQVFVSTVMTSKGSGNPVFFISAPVQEKGTVKGVLTGVVDVNAFAALFVDSRKIGKSGYVYIFQSDGTVIAHPDKAKIFKVNMNDFAFGKEMLQRQEGTLTYSYEGVEKASAFKKVDEIGWFLTAGVPTNELLAPARQIGVINVAVACVVVLLAAVVVFLIARSVANPINQISKGLADGASQVAAASSQIASSSHSLAEGSSEQAASLEETSSSLEEIASMTKQNADNANQADVLMKETNTVVSTARDSMEHLTASMNEITQASEETSKIIKTIDEIAFQTNLLALNAAVEAARAGEAGAGFAVVADEVRNLAMRAADAAKNTSVLIESTLAKVKRGSEYVQQTSGAFEQVEKQSEKSGQLVTEIAAASREQAEGIEQLNRAVTEMDKVVQQNAASAEESSSASQEMSTQADSMHALVRELVALVGADSISAARLERQSKRSAAPPAAAKAASGSGGKATSKQDAAHVIPFEDGADLSDF